MVETDKKKNRRRLIWSWTEKWKAVKHIYFVCFSFALLSCFQAFWVRFDSFIILGFILYRAMIVHKSIPIDKIWLHHFRFEHLHVLNSLIYLKAPNWMQFAIWSFPVWTLHSKFWIKLPNYSHQLCPPIIFHLKPAFIPNTYKRIVFFFFFKCNYNCYLTKIYFS